MGRFLFLLLAMASAVSAFGEMPVPALPKVHVDTAWNPPTGGRDWRAHTATEFQGALDSSSPGDTITLDAGTIYHGSFTVRAKANPNHLWIYIESSDLGGLPAPGKRVNPVTDAVKMPKIVTTDVTPAISISPGASNYRYVGLEVYSTSTQGCDLRHVPRVNCFTYFLIDMPAAQGKALPDSIIVDRCYVHGSDTQDVRAGVVANGTRVGVIGSYISDIHLSTSDSQAVRAYWTPGPIKVENNFLSATTENLMIGGAGGPDNPYVPSDIEIRNNHFFKPERWAAPGKTLPPAAQWSVKNSLELKNARRVLVAGNVFENNWVGKQRGFAIVLTVRTSDSGNIAVVNDITIENNLLKNVASGFNTLERDDQCRFLEAPFCNNPGEAKRWMIGNNLILLRSTKVPGGRRPRGLQVLPELTDAVFQHNTIVPAVGEDCGESVYFGVTGASKWPLTQSDTHNLWITDNVFCRPPTGDFGGQGTSGLMSYMGDPAPLEERFTGNVILVPADSAPISFPSGNLVTRGPMRFVDPNNGNYQMIVPKWTKTTDGKPAGVDAAALKAAVDNAVTSISEH
jgi:hypothetical protein